VAEQGYLAPLKPCAGSTSRILYVLALLFPPKLSSLSHTHTGEPAAAKPYLPSSASTLFASKSSRAARISPAEGSPSKRSPWRTSRCPCASPSRYTPSRTRLRCSCSASRSRSSASHPCFVAQSDHTNNGRLVHVPIAKNGGDRRCTVYTGDLRVLPDSCCETHTHATRAQRRARTRHTHLDPGDVHPTPHTRTTLSRAGEQPTQLTQPCNYTVVHHYRYSHVPPIVKGAIVNPPYSEGLACTPASRGAI
jgi:hypothetical protein